MSSKLIPYFWLTTVCAILLTLASCSTTETSKTETPSARPVAAGATLPELTFLPHPESMDQGDLKRIFENPLAPPIHPFSKECTASVKELRTVTRSKDEFTQGINELIHSNAVSYHWCFYATLMILEQNLRNDLFLDEKQKLVLDAYEFLTPVARAFIHEYHDSRYLRWAVSRYEKYSEMFFMKRVELTPSGTSELVQAEDPFQEWHEPNSLIPVLEKYHIVETILKGPEVKEMKLPAHVPSPLPTPLPAVTPTAALPAESPVPVEPPTPEPPPIETSDTPPISTEPPLPEPVPSPANSGK